MFMTIFPEVIRNIPEIEDMLVPLINSINIVCNVTGSEPVAIFQWTVDTIHALKKISFAMSFMEAGAPEMGPRAVPRLAPG